MQHTVERSTSMQAFRILHSAEEDNLFKSKWKVTEDWRKCNNKNVNTSSNASRIQNQRKISRQVM
jgi:hypothetical protein